jgi:hypothetical protein
MYRLMFATGNVVISLLLGALLLAFIGINFPETLDRIISFAGTVKSYLTGTTLSAKYNVWIRLLLEEKQLVFMFFTIIARIVMSIVTGVSIAVWNRLTGG